MTLKTKTLIVATILIAATGTSILLIKDNDPATNSIADQKSTSSTSESRSALRSTSRQTSSPKIKKSKPLVNLSLNELLILDPSKVSVKQWAQLNLKTLIRNSANNDLLATAALINELYEWSFKMAESNRYEDVQKLRPSMEVRLRLAVAEAMPFLLKESDDFSRDWVKSLQPKSLMKNTVKLYTSKSSHAHGPEKAIQWANGFDDDSLLIDAASILSYHFGKKDFDAAESWVSSLSNGKTRHEGYMGLIEALSVKKEIVPEVYTWLEELQTESPSHNYNYGWSAVSQGVLDSDPLIAMKAAQKIKAASFRNNVIQVNYKRWIAQDPNAAKAWLSENGDTLPPMK